MADDTQTATGGTNEDTDLLKEDKGLPETVQVGTEKISLTMDKRIDLLIMVLWVLFGIWILYDAQDFRIGRIPDPIGSRGMANLVGTVIIILGAALGVMRVLSWKILPGNMVPSEGYADEPGHPSSATRALSIMAGGFLWVWLLQPLGFLIVSPLYLIFTIYLLGVRGAGKLIGFSVIFSSVCWAIFSQLLKIMMPLGPLGPLAVKLGLAPW